MEQREKRALPEFTSALTKKELLFVGAGLVLHTFLLPRIVVELIVNRALNEHAGNFLLYAFMAVYTVIFTWGFLRRDFDPLADKPLDAVFEILRGYFAIMCLNFLTALLLS